MVYCTYLLARASPLRSKRPLLSVEVSVGSRAPLRF